MGDVIGANRQMWHLSGRVLDGIRDACDFEKRDHIKSVCYATDERSGRIGLAVKTGDGQVHVITGNSEAEVIQGMAGRLDYLWLSKNEPEGGWKVKQNG